MAVQEVWDLYVELHVAVLEADDKGLLTVSWHFENQVDLREHLVRLGVGEAN